MQPSIRKNDLIRTLIEGQMFPISRLGLEAQKRGDAELSNICTSFVYDLIDWVRLRKAEEYELFHISDCLDAISDIENFMETYQMEVV